jgi:hypothetical protein
MSCRIDFATVEPSEHYSCCKHAVSSNKLRKCDELHHAAALINPHEVSKYATCGLQHALPQPHVASYRAPRDRKCGTNKAHASVGYARRSIRKRDPGTRGVADEKKAKRDATKASPQT